MTLSLATIESLAPDQASLGAARKLMKPAKWPALESDGELVWGLCQGSGSNPYRVVFDLGDHGYKCTCPSRKFPCKHTLALAWMRVEEAGSFAGGERPEWVVDWLGRRRRSTGPKDDGESEGQGGPRVSAARAAREAEAADAAPSEESRARSDARRALARAQREDLVAGGLDDLEAWTTDVLARGTVASSGDLGERTRPIVRRLVDAKAPALAARLDHLAERVLGLPGPERPAALLEGLGELRLIVGAYRAQGSLREGLRADARAAIGWTTTQEELEADTAAERAAGRFEVVARRVYLQPDGLQRHETWLWPADPTGRPALLLDFVHTRGGAEVGGLEHGRRVEGELVFHASAAPLRARFAAGGPRANEDAGALLRSGRSLAQELARVRAERAVLPWLGARAIAVDAVRLRAGEDGRRWLLDASDGTALPVAHDERTDALFGMDLDAAVVIVDGRTAELHRAATPIGVWRAT